MAQQQLFTAPACRYDADAHFDQADVGLRQGAGMLAMHNHFTASTQRSSSRGGYHRDRAILEHLVRLLQAVDGIFDHLPLPLSGSHQDQEEVGARGEVSGLIADHQGAELLWTLFYSVAQHLDNALVDGVHLGVELDAAYSIAQVDQRGGVVLVYHALWASAAPFDAGQRDGSLWLWYGFVGVALEVEVPLLAHAASVECAPFGAHHTLY